MSQSYFQNELKLKRKEGIDVQKPARLKRGDTVGIIAPAGPVDEESLRRAIPFLEQRGLRVKLGEHVLKKNGFIAGTDEERASDFNQMMADPSVKAIFCARGGYGTGRIASMLDYDLIRSHPKIIWGYSDITYIHTAIRQQADLVTFHGPMIASDVASPDFDERTAQSFDQLFEPTELTYDASISKLHALAEGTATGPLVGGNLSVFMSTIGTPYEIDTTGAILLIEDIGEAPYQIDGLCNQLKQSGKLEEVTGIVIGDVRTRLLSPTERSDEYIDVFNDYFSSLPIPVIAGFQIGHCYPNIGVPLGAQATLSSERPHLQIEHGVV